MYVAKRGPSIILPGGVEPGYPEWDTILVKPDSEKRTKPSDLFRGSTGRTTYSARNNNTPYPAWQYLGNVDPSWSILLCGREQAFDYSGFHNALRGKLLDKIKRQNVNLAQMIAEYRSTAKLFGTLAGELYQGYKALRRGHYQELYRDLTREAGFARKWIELQFGLVPVVMDLQGICLSLADKLRNGEYMYARVTGAEQNEGSRRYLDPSGNGWLWHFERETHVGQLTARWRIADEDLDDIVRFGFSNVPALAWELVPFSFVVDWAIPVGAWLSRLDALIAVRDLEYIQGTRTIWGGQTTHERSGVTATATSDTRSRTGIQTSLSAGFPRYEPSQSLKTIVTGMALLTLLNKGKT